MPYPGEVFLTAEDLPALSMYLARAGWLEPDERVQAAARAGESNMNCVLRVRTGRRSFVVKQSRPWVEKYPDIAAPWDRAVVEARFYREVEREARVAARMPKLLGFDARERVLLLEDLGAARDFTFEGDPDVDAPIEFLIALHQSFRDPDLAAPFRNADMRALNHEHIFAFPLRPDNGMDLDAITPGLASAARRLSEDREYCAEVARLGERYLDDARGTCLLHGDYFPGSWLRARGTVYVIDPEFCFWGPPEWDLGVMLAHMQLTGQPTDRIAHRYGLPLDRRLMAQFAGVEIMRRLIGVAQLPLGWALARKRELLEISRALVAMALLAIRAHAATAVWIDTDPSVMRGGHEVDDGFALIQAFRSPELAVRGVSVVFGNAPLAAAFPIGQRLVKEFGPAGLGVFRGAASAGELGRETDASRALAVALGREKLVVLALGPVTNVATVLQLHPELAKRIKKIVAVAGRRPGQKFLANPSARPFRDFNFELDAPAFQALLDSRAPLILAPWEISSKVWIRPADLGALRSADASLGWLLDAAEDWLQIWKRNLGADGFNPFDTLAVGYAAAPGGFGCERLPVEIQTLPGDTGASNAAKPYLVVDRALRTKRFALYCYEAPAQFSADLLRRLR